jgi:hypothetical protein
MISKKLVSENYGLKAGKEKISLSIAIRLDCLVKPKEI